MLNSNAPVTEAQAYEAMRRAQVEADKATDHPMRPVHAASAHMRAVDSAACFNRGNFWGAANAAIDSLAYSVGKSSEIYRSTLGLVS